jgi:AcrR family transcriptional regulator
VVKQDRAWRTHEKLLDASAQEFVRHGYAGANLQRIAVKTGMTKGALYAHFPSKAALAAALTATFDQEWHRLFGIIHGEIPDVTAVRREGPAGEPAGTAGRPLLTLRLIADGFVECLRTNLRFRAGLRLAFEEARSQDTVPEVIDGMSRVLVQLLRDAQALGEAEARGDPEVLGRFLVSSIFGTFCATPMGELDDLVERVRPIWRLLMPSTMACAQRAGS